VGLLLLVGATACATLPDNDSRSLTTAVPAEHTRDTRLGRAVTPVAERNPKLSGILPLTDPEEAFAVRYRLAEVAERTLDIQYYIWRDDKTGTLLFDALWDAAERGVRVRLLLDDLNTYSLDDTLLELHGHPNIEVRLFNPFINRTSRVLGFLRDFDRSNRRMHNKSFTADNQATIIGGRNISDRYFGAGTAPIFTDLDVLAVGPVVEDVSNDFDLYWASRSAFSADVIIAGQKQAYQPIPERARHVENDPDAARYMQAIRDSEVYAELLDQKADFIWAPVIMVSDSPEKGLGEAEGEDLITYQLREAIGEPRSHIELITPYFVPTRAGVRALEQLAGQGIEITILTNAYESTDVAWVHSGYAKWRKRLLEAGIQLYESRHMVEHRDYELDRFGSGASSLHAKTFSVDGERVFVGSFNFDPRSAALNTELGFIIDSAELATAIDQTFSERALYDAYQVRLSSTGRVYWLKREPGEIKRYDSEPGTHMWERAKVRFFSWLPIDWLL